MENILTCIVFCKVGLVEEFWKFKYLSLDFTLGIY